MALIKSFLSLPRVKKILSLKPGQEGFSLIELVVVVAVLAVLSAIAIPAFDDISQKARATAAANTIAQTVKECAVKIADQGSGKFRPAVALSGYTDGGGGGFYSGATSKAAKVNKTSAEIDCLTSGVIELRSEDTNKYPTFIYNYDSAANPKECVVVANSKADGRVCNGSEW